MFKIALNVIKNLLRRCISSSINLRKHKTSFVHYFPRIVKEVTGLRDDKISRVGALIAAIYSVARTRLKSQFNGNGPGIPFTDAFSLRARSDKLVK